MVCGEVLTHRCPVHQQRKHTAIVTDVMEIKHPIMLRLYEKKGASTKECSALLTVESKDQRFFVLLPLLLPPHTPPLSYQVSVPVVADAAPET